MAIISGIGSWLMSQFWTVYFSLFSLILISATVFFARYLERKRSTEIQRINLLDSAPRASGVKT